MDNNELNKLAARVSRGTMSIQALEFLDDHLRRLSESVDTRIFKKMNSSESVNTDELLQAYGEKNAYNNIRKSLHNEQKLGEASGKKLKGVIEDGTGTDKRRNHATGSFSTYRG